MNDADAATLGSANAYADARSTATLSSANGYTDARLSTLTSEFDQFQNDVWQRFERTDQRIARSGAMQTAMAQMSASPAGIRKQNRAAVGVGMQGG